MWDTERNKLSSAYRYDPPNLFDPPAHNNERGRQDSDLPFSFGHLFGDEP